MLHLLSHVLRASRRAAPVVSLVRARAPVPHAALSTRPERVLTGYRFAKPDGLLEVSVRHAKFRAVGAQGIYHNLVAEGSVRLTLCRAKAGAAPSPSGATQYEYAEKLYVDVTALDIVNIVQSPIAQPVRRGAAGVRGARCAVRGARVGPHRAPPRPPPTHWQITVAYSEPGARGGRAVSRRLDVVPPAAPKAGAVAGAAAPGIALSVANDGAAATVTLAQQEVYLLRNLLGLSIPTLTGWQYQLTPSTFDPAVNLAAPSRAAGGGAGGAADEDDGAAAPAPAPAYAPRAAPAAPSAYPMRGR